MIGRNATAEGGGSVDPDRQRWLSLGVALAFLALAAFAMSSHELWRDEAESWLIARDSSSLPELFRHVRYEGHPGLWFAVLFVLSRVTTSLVAMQLLHLGIAAAVVWTFARYAPFSPLQRVLFAFGYFPLYEYAVVSRDYGLGVLFLFGACAVIGAKPRRFSVLVILLALAPQANIFAAILGFALGLVVLLDPWLPDGPVFAENVSRRQYAWGLAAVAASFGLATVQMMQPADSGVVMGWHTHLELPLLAKRFRSVAAGLLPIAQIQGQWWSSPFVWDLDRVRFPVAIGAYVLLAWVVLGLLHRPRALIFLVVALGGLIAFFYLKLPGEMRHFGHFFIALVMALWLGKVETAGRGLVGDGWIGRAWASTQGTIFTGLLGVQVVGGLLAVFLEDRYVFSNGKATAGYLVEHKLDQAPLVAEPDYIAEPVLAYLPPRQAYFPRGDRTGSFVIWDLGRIASVSDSTCLERARRLAAERGAPAVLLLNHPLAVAAAESLGIRTLARFVGSTVEDEDFYLYSVTATNAP